MAIGRLNTQRAAYDEARRWLLDASTEFARIGDRAGQTMALIETAETHRLQGDHARARAVLEECLRLEGPDGDRAQIARAYHVLGNVMAQVPDLRSAQEWWTKSLDLRPPVEDEPGVAMMITNTAVVAFLEDATTQPVRSSTRRGFSEPLRHAVGEAVRTRQLLALTVAAQGSLRTPAALLVQNVTILRDLRTMKSPSSWFRP